MTSIAMAQSAQVLDGMHLLLLGITVVLSVLVLWGARRLRGTVAATRTYWISGWVLLAASVFYTIWLLLPQNYSLGDSLPLHFSDPLRFMTAVALIRRSWWAVAITYYWGLTLNPQALLTPHPTMLHDPSVHMVFYWVLHIAVFLAPLALIWGAGHRPQWKHFGFAYGAAAAWAALVMPINGMLGTNYGFLNQPPDGASLIDLLGPWPIYVMWLAVLVALVWALMTWPWTRRRTEV